MASQKTGRALAVGWVFGVVASMMGLAGSVQFDLPAAPSILVSLTILLALLGVGLRVRALGRKGMDRSTAAL